MKKLEMSQVKYYIIPLAFLILITCRDKKKQIDTSDIHVEIEIKRLEKDLFNQEFDQLDKNIPDLRKKYGRFFELFNEHIIQIGNSHNPAYREYLLSFITNYEVNKAYHKTMEEFDDIQHLEERFTNAFKRYKYFFPSKNVPSVYTYISGFNQSVVVDDSILGIGLDKYLGQDCKFYDQLGWPEYMSYKMHENKIVPDGMYAWVLTEFPLENNNSALVEHIIHQGKIFYLTKKLLPNVHDTLIFGYTHKQLEFCKNNEEQMWTYLVENSLLYNREDFTIRKFTMDGPFTKDFTRQSPARAIYWLGLQIIKTFTDKNQDVSIQELMAWKDYKEILQKARYRP